MKHTKRTGGFYATGDDGKRYFVIEYTDYDLTRLLNGRSVETPGLKSYKLQNGDHVNPPDQGKNWTVVQTGVELTPE